MARAKGGKKFFHALGQRDRAYNVELTGEKLRKMRRELPVFARLAYSEGFHAY